jgi:diadenosine tetraphosphate (Ap4A) HIT family hydrolase
MSDCVFCRIVAGDVESSRVHEEARVVAFMDIQPVNPGHVLVVPREHAASLAELDDRDAAAMMAAARRVAGALRRSGLRCDGVNLWLADGDAAGQDVFHVHLHVVPRFEGDGFALELPADIRVRDRPELDATAARIRSAFCAGKGHPVSDTCQRGVREVSDTSLRGVREVSETCQRQDHDLQGFSFGAQS